MPSDFDLMPDSYYRPISDPKPTPTFMEWLQEWAIKNQEAILHFAGWAE